MTEQLLGVPKLHIIKRAFLGILKTNLIESFTTETKFCKLQSPNKKPIELQWNKLEPKIRYHTFKNDYWMRT